MRSRSPGLLALAGLGGALLLSGCGPENTGVTLRSLDASGRTSLVCLGGERKEGRFVVKSPRDLDACSVGDPAVEGEERLLHAMVTQTTRGEVAIVDLTSPGIVDLEPTIPGFNFLPVGAAPVDIVSTPGSVATFVGTAEVGKEGIFALPSSCLFHPFKVDGEPRTVTSWPACRLPSAPGDMAILVDPPDENDRVRVSCDSPDRVPLHEQPAPAAHTCSADLSVETRPPGRRKLAVALPDQGEIAILDAQALLDRAPGSFDVCPIERFVRLEVEAPDDRPRQELADLEAACAAGLELARGPFEAPRPGGFAEVDDVRIDEHRLFVSDLAAPVIHVLETKDPCAITESPPLLPMSFDQPYRAVTTRTMAASPLISRPLVADPTTTERKRFLYAVDDRDRGSVMVFDISPASTDRTPIVRPGSPLAPFEPPDRILFEAPVQDLTFALRDRVAPDDETGNSAAGVFCDPDPSVPETDPGAKYRPTPDFKQGAHPFELRGVFAFAALNNGRINVIDVEDFDKPCRRPIEANPIDVENFRGCTGPNLRKDDQAPIKEFRAGKPTVTNEATCNVVESHRARSQSLVLTDDDQGVHAPALRSMPKLLSSAGRTLLTDRTTDGRKHPKMLGVNFADGQPAQVYVGSALLESEGDDPKLEIDPAKAEENSLVLSFVEPRAYPAEEQFSAIYEGEIIGERQGGRFTVTPGVSGAVTLTDSGIGFCANGVEDQEAAEVRAGKIGVQAIGDIAAFGARHADYVTITSELVDKDDAYWRGATECTFLQCRTEFGAKDSPVDRREFRILDAGANVLVLQARHMRSTEGQRAVAALADCCFPEAVSYTVRASGEWVVTGSVTGFRHDIVTSLPPARQCEKSQCESRARVQQSRVLEVSCENEAVCPKDEEGELAFGLATPQDFACKVNETSGPTSESLRTLGTEDLACAYRGLTSRFVIYRGMEPSVRDMQFNWQVVGGFSRITIELAPANDPSTSFQSMFFSREADALVVTDGATKGLVLVDLSTPFGFSSFQ